MYKISIILPVYNVEKYLQQTVKCLVEQSLKEIEIIFVDDESTDSSLEVLREYALTDSRIKVLSQKHSFAGQARNLGLSYATGEYVIFLDPDDYCDINMCEEMYNKITKDESDVALFGIYNIIGNKTKYIAPSYVSFINEFYGLRVFSAKDIKEYLFFFLVYPYNKIIKRSFLIENDIKFQDVQNTNDASFALETLVAASKISLTDKAFYHYRHSRIGNTRLTKGKRMDCVIEAYEYCYERCSKYENFKYSKDGFYCFIVSNLIWHLNEYCARYDVDKEFYYNYVRNYLELNYLNNEKVQVALKAYNFGDYSFAKYVLKLGYKEFCKKINARSKIFKIQKASALKYKFLGMSIFSHSCNEYKEKYKVLGLPIFTRKSRGAFKKTYILGIPVSKKSFIDPVSVLYSDYVENNMDTTTKEIGRK